MIILAYVTNAQSVGIGTANPANSAKLDVASTTQGMTIPRMSTSQRKAISSPTMGLLVYDTDKFTIYMFDGIKWLPMLYEIDDENLLGKEQCGDGNEPFDDFGFSAAMSGNFAAVGRPGFDNGGSSTLNYGAVDFYNNLSGNWKYQTTINPAGLNTNAQFGYSISMNNTYCAIGLPNANNGANTAEGKVYIYKRNASNNWIFFQELTGSNATAGDHFGYSVNIDGKYIIVGAPDDDLIISATTYNNAGSSYVFFFNGSTWTEQEKLYNFSGYEADARLGFSVSIDSTGFAVAGAPYKDVAGKINQGQIALFGRIGAAWTMVGDYTSSYATNPGAANDNYGYSVAMKNQRIIVGAPFYDGIFESNIGALYYLKFISGSGFTQSSVYLGKEFGGNELPNYRIGLALSYDGTNLITGNRYFDLPTMADAGRIEVIRHNTVPSNDFLIHERYLYQNRPKQFNEFGEAVAGSGYNVLGTAPNAGSVRYCYKAACFYNFE